MNVLFEYAMQVLVDLKGSGFIKNRTEMHVFITASHTKDMTFRNITKSDFSI